MWSAMPLSVVLSGQSPPSNSSFALIYSRLINHSCDPSASAKIITINGQSKVSTPPSPVEQILIPDCYLRENNVTPRPRDSIRLQIPIGR